jgi:phage replication O-like protein O
MSIQIDNGEFTRLHNTILERLAVARFTASEYRCLLYLFRMTYGWQKKEDAISLSQWAAGIGIDPEKHRHNALRTLQGLVNKRVIFAKSNGNNRPMTWGFNKNFEQWDSSLFETTVIAPDNSLGATVITPDTTSVITQDNSTVITHDNKTVITPDNYKRKKESIKENDDDNARKPDSAVFKAWAENIPGTMTPILGEKLHDLIDECGEPSVIHGIIVSVEAGVRNFKYIAACARNHAQGKEAPSRASPSTNGNGYSGGKPTALDVFKEYARKSGVAI